jgi:hypothetical protein
METVKHRGRPPKEKKIRIPKSVIDFAHSRSVELIKEINERKAELEDLQKLIYEVEDADEEKTE